MKRLFYHGTSADNLPFILKHGLSTREGKLWTCSEDATYLWCPLAIAKGDNQEDEPNEYKQQRAFQMAFESAQFALIQSKDVRAVVLTILIDDDDIEPDTSAENMEGMGAVCIRQDIKPSQIKEIKISNDLSLLKGYFIALMLDNQYCGLDFTPIEIKVGEAFKKAETFYMDDINDMVEWEAVEHNTKKVKERI